MTDAWENQWGPWIKHDGKGCPDIIGKDLECKVERDFYLPEATPEHCEIAWSRPWLWALLPWPYRVVAYRIRKPRGLVILEQCLRDVPQHVREVV